jgi:thioredoxin 1
MSSFNELIKSTTPVLINLTAEWAPSCEDLKPILKEVKNVKGTGLNIIKIDVDKNESLAKKFNVIGVPALLLFKEGKIIWRNTGLITAPEVLSKIEELI